MVSLGKMESIEKQIANKIAKTKGLSIAKLGLRFDLSGDQLC
jgi:hypothetical protein